MQLWFPNGITSAISHITYLLNSIKKKFVTFNFLTSSSPVNSFTSLLSDISLLYVCSYSHFMNLGVIESVLALQSIRVQAGIIFRKI